MPLHFTLYTLHFTLDNIKITTTQTTFEIPFKNCTFPSLALKDVYIKHFYDLLTFYWHLVDCRSIMVLAPLTYSALLSAQYKPQNIIKQFIKSNLFNNLFRSQQHSER